jgi:hypothetical protein
LDGFVGFDASDESDEFDASSEFDSIDALDEYDMSSTDVVFKTSTFLVCDCMCMLNKPFQSRRTTLDI